MPRWEPDAADYAADSWAYQWVANFARDPHKASEHIGRIACTLGLVKVMQDGAGGDVIAVQSFPEVFMGDALLVSCLAKTLPERQREWLWVHYVYRWFVRRERTDEHGEPIVEYIRKARPLKQVIAADEMHISLARYIELRERARNKLREAMGIPLVSKPIARTPEKMAQGEQAA